MRKQTVVAGCIAGVVAACGGVAVDATGRTMIDAGGALAGMGGALVAGTGGHAGVSAGTGAAGRAGSGGVVAGMGGLMASAGTTLAQAGRALLGGRGGHGGLGGRPAGGSLSSAGTGSVAAQEPTGDGLPRPHWVLRDADGTPVQADVSPGVEPGERIRFGTTTTSVYVSFAGQRRIELCYLLNTGTLALNSECVFSPVTGAADWHASGSYYLDAACNMPAASSTSSIAQVAGQYYYPGEAPVSPATHYTWDKTNSTCVAHPASTLQLWAYKSVPTDIVQLLSDPPYTLELAY